MAFVGETDGNQCRRRVATVALCAVGVALAAPEWLPLWWTREDGPVETATFGCYVLGCLSSFVLVVWVRGSRLLTAIALAFALVFLVAAGEEVSWGQRAFDIDTPSVVAEGNRQGELNLHNLEGIHQRVIYLQLAVAGMGVALPVAVHQRWARAGLPMFVGYLAYRGARGLAATFEVGAAGRNSEASELLLALGLLALSVAALVDARRWARNAVGSEAAASAPTAPWERTIVP